MTLFVLFGKYCLLLYQALRSFIEIKTYKKNFIQELIKTGYDSIPIILLVGVFTGAVLAIQTGYQLSSGLIPPSTIGAIVSRSIIIELGMGIGGLVLAGRIGARIATELGYMRVSEQIDALESMGFNSVSFLVIPRVLAGIISFPILYLIVAATGVLGGLISGHLTGAVTISDYMVGARMDFYESDVVFGLIKATVFGFVITSISCFKGYFATGGAEGVGKVTTEAAVLSCVYLLLSDLILATILL